MQGPVAVQEDDDLHAALARMLEHSLREMLVVDGDGVIVGIIDETEIATVYHRVTQEPAPESTSGRTPLS